MLSKTKLLLEEIDVEWLQRVEKEQDIQSVVNAVQLLEKDGGYPQLLQVAKNTVVHLQKREQPVPCRNMLNEDKNKLLEYDAADIKSWINSIQQREMRQNEESKCEVDFSFLPPVRRTSLVPEMKTQQTSINSLHHMQSFTEMERLFFAQQEKDKGNECFKAKEYHEAAMYYTSSIMYYSDNDALYTNRALTYIKLKNYEKAHTDCDLALSLNHGNFKAYWRKGQAFAGQFMWHKAIEQYRHALRLSTDHPGVLISLREAEKEFANTEPLEAAAHKHVIADEAITTNFKKVLIEEVDGENEKQ